MAKHILCSTVLLLSLGGAISGLAASGCKRSAESHSKSDPDVASSPTPSSGVNPRSYEDGEDFDSGVARGSASANSPDRGATTLVTRDTPERLRESQAQVGGADPAVIEASFDDLRLHQGEWSPLALEWQQRRIVISGYLLHDANLEGGQPGVSAVAGGKPKVDTKFRLCGNFWGCCGGRPIARHEIISVELRRATPLHPHHWVVVEGILRLESTSNSDDPPYSLVDSRVDGSIYQRRERNR